MMKETKNYILQLTKLSYPIFISFLLEIVFGFFDKMIIGRTNLDGFNSVSFMVTFLYVITGAVGMISTCFNIIYNKKIKNVNESNNILSFHLTISLILGVLFELLFIFLGKPFIISFYHLKGEALKYAYDYLIVAGPTVLLNMFIFIFSSMYRSHKNTKIQAIVTLVSLIVNLVLDYSLVFGIGIFPKLGPVGAAIGTTIGLFAGLLIYVFNLRKYLSIKIKFLLEKDRIRKLYKTYIPLFLQELCETTIFMLCITSIVSNFSKDIIGAYNVIDTINGFMILIAYGYASASLTLTLQENKKEYPLCASIITFIVYILISILLVIFIKNIAGIIITDKNVINVISKFVVLGLLSQLFNCTNQIYKQILQGYDKEKWVLYVSTIISLVALVIIYLLNITHILNLNVMYIILLIMYVTDTTIYVIKYNKIYKSRI